MSSSPTELKLAELAEACGVSPRTVRYYVQRGLLPAPVFRGRDTAYGEEHRVRLLAIKKLQEAYLPLDAIERELKQRPLSELREIAEGAPLVSPPAPGAASVPPAQEVAPQRSSERYRRFVLAPGLELHLSEDASEEVKQWAERIRRQS